MARKSLAERVVHCEGYPLWEDGDDELMSSRGVGSTVTRGQVRVFLDALGRGMKTKDATAMSGVAYNVVTTLCRTHPELMQEFRLVEETAAFTDEEKAIEVLETADASTAQLANYLSMAYRWRAAVRNRKRYGEHREGATEVRVGVVILPAESWGREAGAVPAEVMMTMPKAERLDAGE